jgi:sigma-B regulation protein RsbU (phosphoserine phosphatase)
VTDEIRSAIRERRECTVEILNFRKDGVPFWNRLSLTPVRSESGETTHYIGVQSDVTKRRKAEEALHVANEKLEKANQRMSRDLEAAAKIQQSLLPQNLPEFEDASFCWEFEPCDELAGDFLNVLPLDGEHVAFYTLDVSGHGVPAALLSVSLSHWLSPVPGRSCLLSPAPNSASGFSVTPPSQVAEVLNREFPMDLNTAQYFTISYGVLNRATGRLRYVTAGSPPPLLVPRNGESEVLAGAGFPIGMFPKPGYEEQTVELSPGDRLFLFTDGVIEATNASDEPFWTDRLRAAVDENRSESLEGCLHSVLAEVRDWNAGDRFEDDATILALEFRGRT